METVAEAILLVTAWSVERVAVRAARLTERPSMLSTKLKVVKSEGKDECS